MGVGEGGGGAAKSPVVKKKMDGGVGGGGGGAAKSPMVNKNCIFITQKKCNIL